MRFLPSETEIALEVEPQGGDHRERPFFTGGGVERFMELRIQRNYAVGRLRLVELGKDTRRPFQIGLRYLWNGPFKRLRFNQAAKLGHLQGLVGGNRGNANAAARLRLNEALGDELLERLAHDHLTDPQTAGKCVLQQAVPSQQG